MGNDGQTPLNIYLIAGESSGDLLGAHLMRSLKKLSPRPVVFSGVGGERMTAEGLASLFPYHELSMLGFLEVLPHLFNIFARINATVDDIIAKQPDVVVTIDAPGFSSRVIERLRKEHFKSKFVHYVAPTVWAYKPQRVHQCARLFDHMLVLLPFEPPYFEAAGLPCTFVGHPVVAETGAGNGTRFREKYNIAEDTLLITLLPGSRRGEIRRLMPIFGRAVTLLAAQNPGIAMAVAVPKQVMPYVAPYFEGCPFRAVITAGEEDRRDAITASRIAIVKSGTVALEVAHLGTPMVVTYRVNALSAWVLRRMILTRYMNLINILLKREAVPELMQELCDPLLIASAAAAMLDSGRGEHQKKDAKIALASLLPESGQKPSDIAASTILQISSYN